MLPAGWLVAAVVVAVLLTMWVMFTLTRLDRLHARVDAAQAALDAQLVRRSAALLRAVEVGAVRLRPGEEQEIESLAGAALSSNASERQAVENQVGRTIGNVAGRLNLADASAEELREASDRVVIARRFYNDAVRDTRALRNRRMPRLLHLAGQRELPQFFDIDDTVVFDGADHDEAENSTPTDPPHEEIVQ